MNYDRDLHKSKIDVFFKTITAFIAIIATILALFFQFVTIREKKTTAINDAEINMKVAELAVLTARQKETELALHSLMKSSIEKQSLQSVEFRFKELDSKINKLAEQNLGLRQAINPLSPDEILTIVRLKDSVNILSSKVDNLEKDINEKQDSFKNSVIRELDSSGKAMNLILVVLIPLVLNLLYSSWRDRKESKEKNRDADKG